MTLEEARSFPGGIRHERLQYCFPRSAYQSIPIEERSKQILDICLAAPDAHLGYLNPTALKYFRTFWWRPPKIRKSPLLYLTLQQVWTKTDMSVCLVQYIFCRGFFTKTRVFFSKSTKTNMTHPLSDWLSRDTHLQHTDKLQFELEMDYGPMSCFAFKVPLWGKYLVNVPTEICPYELAKLKIVI